MVPRASDTRQRMLNAAADLLSEQGTAGTTIDAVLVRSGAPRGSVYHHFPGGRNEVVLGAVQMVGDRINATLHAAEAGGPQQALEEFAAFWRRQLVRSDYLAGCPVVALAVGGTELIADADALVADVFAGWQANLTTLLVAAGKSPQRARRLAHLLLAAMQGAVVLCRAERDVRPLDDVVAELGELLAAA